MIPTLNLAFHLYLVIENETFVFWGEGLKLLNKDENNTTGEDKCFKASVEVQKTFIGTTNLLINTWQHKHGHLFYLAS